jgi:hypothetical protein
MVRGISPIQFVGTQRSGSNLLRVMLNQFSEISAPHPPHILKTFFPLLPLYGDLDDGKSFRLLVADVCQWVNINPVPWDNFHLDAGHILKLCRRNSLIELFTRIYEQKALQEKKRFWCCKSMESIYFYNEIEQSRLAPFYIHIYRDGRDVALSFMKAIVGPKHIYFLAKKWKEEQELSLQLRSCIDSKRTIAIRYEDLIHNPSLVIQSICLKLGISYSEKALDYFHSYESISTANSGQMWTNLAKPIIPDNHNKFERELTEEQLMIFERVAGDMLIKLGYKTICRPDLPSGDFTREEIETFYAEDKIAVRKILAQADPYELNRRKPQEELLNQIKARKTTMV